ncbi:uncharacterized protein PSFLO_01849 [Pseudozyma flocculosa]|uniref:Uncharacterized protein n=1 Tax=Pseudozyma flocculosa TaxID=84751 RepID=A0A5C3EVV6_9BASI|nr:uncharacterized protein PSFLO_01849 [Pseudozyma flocculosa]
MSAGDSIPTPAVASASVEIRQRIMALRKAKMEALQAEPSSTGPPSLQVPEAGEDRFSWVGVDDGEEVVGCSTNDRASDGDDDNDSTTISSIASTSFGSASQDEEEDSQSAHTLTTVDESSDHASRKGSRRESQAKRRSATRQARPSTSSSVRSTASATAKPLGPPPDLPLPPKPQNSPAASLKSPALGWSSRPQASARSMGKRSSKSSFRSTDRSTRSSSRLSGDELSELSADEISSIRRISSYFPTPASPLPANASQPGTPGAHAVRHSAKTERQGRTGSGSRSEDRRTSPFWSPRSSTSLRSPSASATADAFPTSQHEARSVKGGPRIMVQEEDEEEDQERLPDSLGGSRDDGNHGDADNDGEDDVSDSDLSEVLHITAREGILAVAQRASPVSAGQIARIGLGLGSSSRSPSRSLSGSSSPVAVATPAAAATAEALDSQFRASSEAENAQERRRNSQMHKNLNGLVQALDQEAARWSLDSPDASPRDSIPSAQPSAPSSERVPRTTIALQEALSRPASAEPAATAIAPLQSSASLPNVLLQAPVQLAPSTGAPVGGSDVAVSQPARPSGMTASISAPTVRIQDTEGMDGSASDVDFTTDDDYDDDGVPRKRTKQARHRRRGFGFEDQRATLSRGNSSRSLQPGQVFRPNAAWPAPSSSAKDKASTDPYAFYEFSPSLPPFVPAGLQPRDLTGTGTWSSIVARANSTLSRHTSVRTMASTSTTASLGPVSLKEVAAGARAKMEQAEAARKARESQSELFAKLSYRPFEIHHHAETEAKAMEHESTVMGESSGRSTAMSRFSNSSTMGELATRWPVAIGEGDQDLVGGDVGSDVATARSSLLGLGIKSLAGSSSGAVTPPAKVYAEVCMQTSPASTPPPSPKTQALLTLTGASTLDPEQTPRAEKPRRRVPARRRTMAAMSQAYGIDLDMPGFKPTRMRAPRLSGRKSDVGVQRLRSSVSSNRAATVISDATDKEILATSSSSGEESDLDIGAQLEELADRTGVLDDIRGAKRKLRRSKAPAAPSSSDSSSLSERAIATIPVRARSPVGGKSAARVHSARRRVDSGTGWTSSEDESDDEVPSSSQNSQFLTPQPPRGSGNFQLRPLLLPRSVPAKTDKRRIAPLRGGPRSSGRSISGFGRAPNAGSTRADSPDLSFQSLAGDDEDEDNSLLSAKLDEGGNTSIHLLDDDDDSVSKQAPTMAAGNAVSADSHLLAVAPPKAPTPTDDNVSAESNEAVEILKEAEEVLSSVGHSQPAASSSGHGSISDSCGTSGHDPQRRPNEVLAEIVRQRLALRLETALSGSPSTLMPVPAPSIRPYNLGEGEITTGIDDPSETAAIESSPLVQDTPDTMAGSDAWSTFRTNDRDSSVSTATSWSGGSFVEKPEAPQEQAEAIVEAAADPRAPTGSETASADVAAKIHDAVASPLAQPSPAKPAQPAARPSSLPRTLHRKASALPMPSSNRRSASETVGSQPLRPRSNEVGTPVSAASLKDLYATKKAQRPSLPPPVAYARHAQAVASPKLGGGGGGGGGGGSNSSGSNSASPADGASRLRKMKSFGDRSSNSFVPPPTSTLPRSIAPRRPKVPASLDSSISRNAAGLSIPSPAPSTPSKLAPAAAAAAATATATPLRPSGIPAPRPSLKHHASLSNMSRLPTPSTPGRSLASPRVSGLPLPSTPSGIRQKRQ